MVKLRRLTARVWERRMAVRTCVAYLRESKDVAGMDGFAIHVLSYRELLDSHPVARRTPMQPGQH